MPAFPNRASARLLSIPDHVKRRSLPPGDLADSPPKLPMTRARAILVFGPEDSLSQRGGCRDNSFNFGPPARPWGGRCGGICSFNRDRR